MTTEEALVRWAAICAGGHGDAYHYVRIDEGRGATTNAFIHTAPCEHGCLTRVPLRRPVDLLIGVAPRAFRDPDAVREAPMLWVAVQNTKGNNVLERFRVKPSIVLREGDTLKRYAYWPLTKALRYDFLRRGNRRLAHWFKAPMAFAAPETLLPPPGALVKGDRVTPVPIVVERFTDDRFDPRDVVGWLPEAPEKRWRPAA